MPPTSGGLIKKFIPTPALSGSGTVDSILESSQPGSPSSHGDNITLR